MAGVTWDSIFPGNPAYVRKALYGSVLVMDYSAANSFATYSPFDPTTGLLSSTLLTSDGWTDIGYLDENGVEFTPNYTTADTMSFQTRQPLRTDVTADTEQAKITALQSTPVTDCLYNSIAVASAGVLGGAGYVVTKPKVPSVVPRSLLFLGVDGGAGSYIFEAKLYPRALMVKPDKQDWVAKTEIQVPLTFQAYPDAVAGYSVKRFRDGPGWRAMAIPNAPTAVTLGVKTATTLPITWTAPATGPIPASYTVSVVLASNGVPVSGATFLPTNPNTTTTACTVGGLVTATTYVVSVVATNANGSSAAATLTATTS
jgi:hypothetical protein